MATLVAASLSSERPKGATVLSRTSDSTNRVAFVGELGLKAQANVTEWLTLDAGYQLLFINGVALAGEQPRGIDMQPGLAATSTASTGDVLYHRLTVSATIRFQRRSNQTTEDVEYSFCVVRTCPEVTGVSRGGMSRACRCDYCWLRGAYASGFW